MTVQRNQSPRGRSPTTGLLPLVVVVAVAVHAGSPAAMAVGPSPPPAAATAPAVDEGTSDALRDIGAVTLPAAADTPGRAAESARPAAPPAAGGWPYWSGLVAFFAPALVVAAAVGVSGSVVGTFVLLRREALLALALPQVVAVGAAVGLRQGWPTLPPAMAAAAVGLAYLARTRRRTAGHGGAAAAPMAVPALYVGGLCASFLVIAGSGAHVEELQKRFAGIDVAVTPGEAAVVAPLLLAAAAACAVLWRRWLVLAQAPAAAELAGTRPGRTDGLFLALLAVVLLLGTSAQGVVMVLAMLFLPPAIVQPWARRVPTAMATASAASLLCLTGAFAVANGLDWPLSQTVGGIGCAALAASRAAARLARR